MKNRGLRDIFVACIDGLGGFGEAIHVAYPQAKVQLCIVHLVRAALRYVSQQDSKAVIAGAIESVNSVIRKFTRNRKIYPNEESAIKLVFIAIREAAKKWTMPIRHWKEALNHFAIMFENRMPPLTSK